MALRAVVKSATSPVKSSVVHLYRAIIKELPRVMTIYDVDMSVKEARAAVAFHFRKHSSVEDSRVINLLLARGYMELEETLMQWKQKTHLLRILEPAELAHVKEPQFSDREKFIFGIQDSA